MVSAIWFFLCRRVCMYIVCFGVSRAGGGSACRVFSVHTQREDLERLRCCGIVLPGWLSGMLSPDVCGQVGVVFSCLCSGGGGGGVGASPPREHFIVPSAASCDVKLATLPYLPPAPSAMKREDEITSFWLILVNRSLGRRKPRVSLRPGIV